MLDNFDNETIKKIDYILDGIKYPKKKEWDVDEYHSLFRCNKQYHMIQWLNMDQYLDALEEISKIEYSDRMSVLMSSFVPNDRTETALKMIELIETEYDSNIYDQLTIFKNHIIDYYYHIYRNNSLLDLKSDIEGIFLTDLKNTEFLNIHAFNGDTRDLLESLEDIIENNKTLDFSNSTFGEHIVYITVLSFRIVRSVIYRDLDKFIIDKVLKTLEESKNFYFQLLEENKILPNSIQRLSSLISCYREIQIKLEIEESGIKSAKKYVDAYFEDMLFFEKYVGKHLIITDRKKALINFIEIAYFYKYMRIDTNTIPYGNNKVYLKDYYYHKVMKTIHDLDFINKQKEYEIKHSLFFGLVPSLFYSISEIGLFITSLNLFNLGPGVQESILKKTFLKFFEDYRTQNYDHPFVSDIDIETSFGYIWR